MNAANDKVVPELLLDREILRRNFDVQPFGFDHTLHQLPLFRLDALHALAAKYANRLPDTYVSGTVPSPETKFYSGKRVPMLPHEAVERLGEGEYRVLLKRPENVDESYRDLLHTVFKQMLGLLGGLGKDRLARLESAIFITSARTITPFHYDPEVNFFSQIEGEKIYHVYAPACLTEQELEQFYVRGILDIAQVDLADRDRRHEHTFTLAPGKGLHQPQNAPHWAETTCSRSISYVFVYETEATRAKGRVRAFNHYARSIGITPDVPGRNAAIDAAKAAAMRAVLPLKRRVGRAVRAIRR